jgi:hypothetical protein
VRVRALVGSLVLVLVGVGCSSSAKQASPVRAGAGGVGIAGLDLSGPSGVNAVGSATQKVPADRAFVVVARGDRGFSSSSGSSSTIGPGGAPVSVPTSTTVAPAQEHDAVRAALRPLGIASDAIGFSLQDSSGINGPAGSGVVQVEVPVAKLPKIGIDARTADGAVVGHRLRASILVRSRCDTKGDRACIADRQPRDVVVRNARTALGLRSTCTSALGASCAIARTTSGRLRYR